MEEKTRFVFELNCPRFLFIIVFAFFNPFFVHTTVVSVVAVRITQQIDSQSSVPHKLEDVTFQ